MTNRQKALEWWEKLSSELQNDYLKVCQQKDLVPLFTNPQNITGRLIEIIFEEEAG